MIIAQDFLGLIIKVATQTPNLSPTDMAVVQKEVGFMNHVQQAEGVIEYAMLGVSGIFGAGILSGLVLSAWQGVKQAKHLGRGIVASTAMLGLGTTARVATLAKLSGLAGKGAAALESARTTQGMIDRSGLNPVDMKGAGGLVDMAQKTGASGMRIEPATGGAFKTDMQGVLSSQPRSLDHVLVDPSKIDRVNFEAAADRVAVGGKFQVGRDIQIRHTDGLFYQQSAIPKDAPPGTQPDRTVSIPELSNAYYSK